MSDPAPQIRPCRADERARILEIINDAAHAYAGVIPADRYHEPYMPDDELDREIAAGVRFWGIDRDGTLAAVMGVQDVRDVTLIRRAYTATRHRGTGLGGALLRYIVAASTQPLLIGTWADATWAIGFYERNGFARVAAEDVPDLLQRYWNIPARQVETSVVLADARWRAQRDS